MFDQRLWILSSLCLPAFLFLSVAAQGEDELAARGEKLVTRLGCMECHTVHGKGAGIFAEVKAPEWANSLGTMVMMESGEKVKITWDYLLRSIMEPDAQVVKGYPAGKMPTKFAHMPKQDVVAIVAYIASLTLSEMPPIKMSLEKLQLMTERQKKARDAARGKKLVHQLGCMECHTVHGKGLGIFAEVKAPDWAEIVGTTVEMESGEEVKITGDYLVKSIMKPDAQVIKGYSAGLMPAWFAEELPKKDVAAIVAYIETLTPSAVTPPKTLIERQEKDREAARGKMLVQQLGCMECHTVAGKGHRIKAPDWAEIFGTTVEMESGEEVKITEDYLVRSIMEPDAQIVKGHPAGKMPGWFAELSTKDMVAIVTYIASLTPSEASEDDPTARGLGSSSR